MVRCKEETVTVVKAATAFSFVLAAMVGASGQVVGQMPEVVVYASEPGWRMPEVVVEAAGPGLVLPEVAVVAEAPLELRGLMREVVVRADGPGLRFAGVRSAENRF